MARPYCLAVHRFVTSKDDRFDDRPDFDPFHPDASTKLAWTGDETGCGSILLFPRLFQDTAYRATPSELLVERRMIGRFVRLAQCNDCNPTNIWPHGPTIIQLLLKLEHPPLASIVRLASDPGVAGCDQTSMPRVPNSPS